MQAHSTLSTIYEFGLFNIPEDIDRANSYNLEGAKRGSSIGKVNYGLHNLHSSKKDISQRAHDYLVEVAAEDSIGGLANQHLTELYYFGNDHYESNYENARLFAENCVAFGDSEGACEFILARDFQNGWGGPEDQKRSAELFLLGAQAGNARAMWYAGMNALNGNNVEKNEMTAFEWVSKAADSDDKEAMISLGVMYALGQGTAIDYEKSYASYERAAMLESAHAIRSMAGMHCGGEGQAVNDKICLAGLILATKHNDDEAPLLLENWFDLSNFDMNQSQTTLKSEFAFWTNQFPWLLEIPLTSP